MSQRLSAGSVLTGTAALAPPLAVVFPLGLAPLFALAAAAAPLAAIVRRERIAVPWLLVAILAAAISWAALSALWAYDVRPVWREWPRYALTLVGSAALLAVARGLAPSERQNVGAALAFGYLAALGLLVLEALSPDLLGFSIAAKFGAVRTYFNRSVAALVLFIWPVVAIVATRRGPLAALTLALAAALVLSFYDSMAAILGLALGAAAFAVSWPAPRRVGVLLAAALVLANAAAPVIPRLPWIEAQGQRRDVTVSVFHRLEIWHFAALKIAERPLLGWGFNASRVIPGGRESIDSDGTNRGAGALPLHPHNAVLQWWLELGAVGAAIGAALLALAAIGAGRLAGVAAPAALALVVSGTAIAGLGYGIWQSWWLAALALAAAFMSGSRPEDGPAPVAA